MAGVKIVDLPALGRDLINTDLLEVSLNGGGSRKITGQEIMNASKLAIGSTPIVSGTVGRLLFQGTGDVLQQSGNLFWDEANGRLGIGTNTPATSIDTTGIIRVGGTFVYGDTNNQYLRLSNVHGTFLGYNTSNIAIVASSVRLIANGVEVLRAFQTGNVLIGTTTDAGFRLDVNGTARVQGNVSITGGSGTNLTLTATSGTGSILTTKDNNFVSLSADGTSGFISYGVSTTGTRVLRFIGNGSEVARIATTGNVLINTTTDDGFRLDVNGNTRISGDVTAVRVVSSVLRDGNNNAYINNSLINIATTNLAIGGTTVQDFTFTTKTSGGKYVFNNANVLINTTTDAGFRLDVNGTARVQGATTFNNSLTNTSGGFSHSSASPSNDAFFTLLSSNIRFYVRANGYCKTTTSIVTDANGLGSVDASAISQIDSTTKGFLPPRMTNAQRAAIASPAVGLIVYCTDATEGLYVYKSTGWTFMV